MRLDKFVHQLRKRVKERVPELTAKRRHSAQADNPGEYGDMEWLPFVHLTRHRHWVGVKIYDYMIFKNAGSMLFSILVDFLKSKGFEGRVRLGFLHEKEEMFMAEIGEFARQWQSFVDRHPSIKENDLGETWYQNPHGGAYQFRITDSSIAILNHKTKPTFSSVSELEEWIYERDEQERVMVEWQQTMCETLEGKWGDLFLQTKERKKLIERYYHHDKKRCVFFCPITEMKITAETWPQFKAEAETLWEETMRRKRLRHLL